MELRRGFLICAFRFAIAGGCGPLVVLVALLGSVSVAQEKEAPAVPEAKPADEVERLTTQLASDGVEERLDAVRKLSGLDRQRVLTPLTLALRDTNCQVKKEAALALGKLGDERALEPLREFFYRHGSPPYLGDSYLAIGALGAIGAAAPLAGARAAKAILEAMRDEAHLVYGEVQDQYCQIAADALMKIGDAAVNECATALTDPERCVRLIAARALGTTSNPDALAPLLRALDDDDPSIRILVARSLGNFKDTRSAEALVRRAANDDEVHFRTAATQSLVRVGAAAVQPLRTSLASDDCYFAAWAAQTLGEVGDREAVRALLKVAESPSAVVRNEAARALGKLGDSQAAEPLARLLTDNNAAVRSSAATALGRLGVREAAPKLVRLLKDAEWQVRVAAADAVGDLKEKAVTVNLEEALGDTEMPVRVAAALALGKLRATSAVPRLVALLNDANAPIVAGAATALGDIAGAEAQAALLAELKQTTKPSRDQVAVALGRAGNAGTASELADLAAKEDSVHLRALIRTTLAAMGEGALEALRAMAGAPSAEVRGVAIGALSDMANGKAVAVLLSLLPTEADPALKHDIEEGVIASREIAASTLLEALRSDKPEVRALATQALRRVASPDIIALYEKALRDESEAFRRQVIQLLAARREDAAVEPLIRALEHEDKVVASAAAHALGQIKDKRAIEPLGKALAEAKGDFAWACLCGLGEMRDPRVVEPLLEILKTTENADIRWACIGLLGHTREPKVLETIQNYGEAKDRRLREAALYAMGEIGGGSVVRKLADLLDRNDERAEGALATGFIITALGQTRSTAAAQKLIAFLTEDEDRRNFSWVVGKALGDLGEPALEPVLALLKDRNLDLREAATKAMGQIGGPAAVEPLLMTLRWGDAPVCLAAIEGLERIGDRRALGAIKELAEKHPDERVRGKAKAAAKR